MAAVGGGIAFCGALLLLAALAILASMGFERAGVDPEMAAWLGPGSVGLIIAIVGMVMLWQAKNKLASSSMVPTETVASLRDGKEWMKEKLSHS
jgi:TRAP-type uncharacterized transport system fused permease subunit